MASIRPPVHLNNPHRDTFAQILRHPGGHIIEWHSVVSTVEVVGSIEQTQHGRLPVTLRDETETCEPPTQKDIDEQQVVDVRRTFMNARYGSDHGHAASIAAVRKVAISPASHERVTDKENGSDD
jgi:hypothetical protein